jgi:Homeodomain-like domain-containing protein
MPAGRTQRKARKLDRAKVMELAEQGMSTADIAQHQRVAPSTIFRFLQQTEPTRQALEVFKKNRGDVFAQLAAKSLDLQDRIVDTFNDQIITALKPHEKGSLILALNIQAGTLYDKERLERGLSTSNQALSLLGQIVLKAEERLGAAPKAEPATTPSLPPVRLAHGVTGSGFEASQAPSELDSTACSSET